MEEKNNVRIGDLAISLGIDRSVIRFWEKEFDIRTKRSDGGQRYYSANDVKKFEIIKELLYSKGYTISGARKYLKDMPKKTIHNISCSSQAITMEPATHAKEEHNDRESGDKLPDVLAEQITQLHYKLMKLRELL